MQVVRAAVEHAADAKAEDERRASEKSDDLKRSDSLLAETLILGEVGPEETKSVQKSVEPELEKSPLVEKPPSKSLPGLTDTTQENINRFFRKYPTYTEGRCLSSWESMPVPAVPPRPSDVLAKLSPIAPSEQREARAQGNGKSKGKTKKDGADAGRNANDKPEIAESAAPRTHATNILPCTLAKFRWLVPLAGMPHELPVKKRPHGDNRVSTQRASLRRC